jgi:hypothetical protein
MMTKMKPGRKVPIRYSTFGALDALKAAIARENAPRTRKMPLPAFIEALR